MSETGMLEGKLKERAKRRLEDDIEQAFKGVWALRNRNGGSNVKISKDQNADEYRLIIALIDHYKETRLKSYHEEEVRNFIKQVDGFQSQLDEFHEELCR